MGHSGDSTFYNLLVLGHCVVLLSDVEQPGTALHLVSVMVRYFQFGSLVLHLRVTPQDVSARRWGESEEIPAISADVHSPRDLFRILADCSVH